MHRPSLALPLVALALAAAACELDPAGRTLALDATGAVQGRLYVDRNGNGRLDPSVDAPAAGFRLSLVRGAADTVASATTGADGVALLSGVPVGTYRLAVDAALLGDSVEIASPDSARVSVPVDDTVSTTLALGYPRRTVAEARGLRGRSVSLRGVALGTWAVFGDSTLHLADSTGAIRAVRVPSTPLQPGDTVRLTGRIGESGGQPVLVAPSVLVIGSGSLPAPAAVGTGVAATAQGGALDAAQVSVSNAVVFDVSRTGEGDTRLRVDDGSGVLEVVLDRSAGITSEDPVLPGAIVDVTGLLVPSTTPGTWILKPRGTADVRPRYPSVPIVEARGMTGKVVSLFGLALNGWTTFGDATVHLADSTAAIRGIQVSQSFVEAGDSLRVLGVIAIREGQPVLANGSVSILAKGRTLPAPVVVTTALAASADGGRLDARLVRVADAAIADTAVVGPDLRITVDDGSGVLTVLLDGDTGIGRAGVAPGATFSGVGLLVPNAGGREWVLKPRGPADVQVR